MSYRKLSIQKKSGGRVRRYKNLRAFNQECGARSVRGNICTITNIRELRDGSGLATVRSESGPFKGKPSGTWLLHFADYSIMVRHLDKRALRSTAWPHKSQYRIR